MSVEERTTFWQAKADLQMAKRHLEILIAAWRGALPALETAGRVLDQRHVARINARYPAGPIPVGETSFFHPKHRETVDGCTGPEARAVLQDCEDLLAQISEALTSPDQRQPEGEDDGHPDQPTAA
jgi:hypothetical protein